MADGGLSIGTLSGQIELDDKFTATIHLSNDALEELEKRFGGAHTGALKVAEGMITAEAAIEAVKEVAHLAAEAISEMTVQGGKVAGVEKNFDRLTLSAGQLGDELLGSLKQGTHNTITDFELMKSVNDNLAVGVKLTAEQYNVLATGSFALAKAKGIEVKQAFDDINYALETGKVKTVQYLTGKIDLAAAEDKYAVTLHTTADRLSAAEKQEAARLEILAKLGQTTERLGEQGDGLNTKIAQWSTKWENFAEDLGKTVATSPAVLKAFDDIGQILTDAFGGNQEELIETIAKSIGDAATAAVEFVKVGVEVVQFVNEYKEFLEPLVVAIGAYYTASILAAKGTEAMEAATVALEAGVTPLLAVAAAAGAIYAAFELGKWKPISDFFEKLALETFYNMSSAEADAAVATHHLTEETEGASKAAHELKDAHEEIKIATQNYKEVLDTIDGKVVDWAEHLLATGVSAKSVATEYGLTAAQVKALQVDIVEANKASEEAAKAAAAVEASTRMSRQELKQYVLAWSDLNSIGKTYEETLKGVNPEIVESVKYYAEAGASVKELTAAFPGLTKAQAEAAVEGAKGALELQKVWDETLSIIAKSHGDNIKDWIDGENRKFKETVALLTLQGKATADMLDAELNKHNATIDAELKKRAEANDQTKAYWQKQYDDAKNNYDLLVKLGSDATATAVRDAARETEEKRRQLENWTSAAADAHAKVGQNVKELSATTSQYGSSATVVYTSVLEAIEAMNNGVDESKIKVRSLSGELETLAEAKKRFDTGGSFAVTSQNFAQTIESLAKNSSGFNTSQAYDLAAKGYSLQEITDIMARQAQGNYGNIPPPQGPAIPGFGTTPAPTNTNTGTSSSPSPTSSHTISSTPTTTAGSLNQGSYSSGGGGGVIVPSMYGTQQYVMAVPGFAKGGIGDFGDGTLAMLHGKEAIIPLDAAKNASAPAGDVYLTFQVNGTAVQAAQQIKDIIMRELKQVRQFGAA